MTPKSVIAVFDIGKTNKKLFLFDEQYSIVLEKSKQFPETVDEDGDPCEDLTALTQWVKSELQEVITMEGMLVKAVNFSTYGASFVHIGHGGEPVAPLYNYLKPFPEGLKEKFFGQWGDEASFSLQTASPPLGNLNSGLQLYMLKWSKPAIFNQIQYSLHLPQYMNYLVSGIAYSDITSVGCHTGLWDFDQSAYHPWVQAEDIDNKLAPVFPSDQLMPADWGGYKLLAGVGLHDSSAALIPYLSYIAEPFVLISTGTWCITLNPFNQTPLTASELQQDCLCYMEYRGKPVKASRLFAGYDHEQQVKRLADHFGVPVDYYKNVQFDPALVARLHLLIPDISTNGKIKTLMPESPFAKRELSQFDRYELAYHQLIRDLMVQQVASTDLVMVEGTTKKIFVDGGFGRNPVYMNLLAAAYPGIDVYAASVAQASAIGAAIAVHPHWNGEALPADLIQLKHFPASRAVSI
ncbi:MAG: carbohydrate kinase [Williamsia sp.]|nr:carbohydrate kinase [Williamsia sp.]